MKKHYYLVLTLLLISVFAKAQSYKMHTLYIYSFSKYIVWPGEAAQGDFIIGVLGDSPIEASLQKMASLKKVNGRVIKVTSFDDPQSIGNCNILFLPQNQSNNLAKALNIVGNRSILVVTEKEGLGAQGSALNFIVKNNKLLFELNNEAVDKANLKVASELKKYAVQL